MDVFLSISSQFASETDDIDFNYLFSKNAVNSGVFLEKLGGEYDVEEMVWYDVGY